MGGLCWLAGVIFGICLMYGHPWSGLAITLCVALLDIMY